MSAVIAPPVTRFHLSLNVADLDRSVGFFRAFLGIEPAKLRGDYAKFELDEPPVVLSLEPHPAAPGGNLNHLGFRMPTGELLVDCQRRLEVAGISTQREEGVECCYARQTKFWVHDPDGNLWEIYTLDDDLDHRGAGQLPEIVMSPASRAAPPLAIWTHLLGQPWPERLPILDATVDRVALQGTFNSAQLGAKTDAVLREVVRILKPGGELQLHVLTGDRPQPPGPLSLPGPAATVEHVPVDAELARSLATAGLAAIRFTKLGQHACFTVAGVQMRETKIEAIKPAAAQAPTKTVLYLGPFRQLEDDAGRIYHRGERVSIDRATCDRLQSTQAANFAFLED